MHAPRRRVQHGNVAPCLLPATPTPRGPQHDARRRSHPPWLCSQRTTRSGRPSTLARCTGCPPRALGPPRWCRCQPFSTRSLAGVGARPLSISAEPARRARSSSRPESAAHDTAQAGGAATTTRFSTMPTRRGIAMANGYPSRPCPVRFRLFDLRLRIHVVPAAVPCALTSSPAKSRQGELCLMEHESPAHPCPFISKRHTSVQSGEGRLLVANRLSLSNG